MNDPTIPKIWSALSVVAVALATVPPVVVVADVAGTAPASVLALSMGLGVAAYEHGR